MTNSEILGNKLYELRKKNGLSQEALADRLGVSRQAVSKWECGESLPDTDNLITISKLYGISLDELVGNTTEKSSETDNLSRFSKITSSSIKEGGYEKYENEDSTEEKSSTYSEKENLYSEKKKIIIKVFSALPYSILVTIAFLLWGFLANGWAVAWTLFITIPVYDSLIYCIKLKRCSPFAYPVFITFVYLFIGMQWGLWHPYWVLFITIPIFGAVADAIDRK